MSAVQLRVLGEPIWRTKCSAGQFSQASLLLLKLRLASSPPSRSELIDFFWPTCTESVGRHNLRQLLHRLRRNWPELELVSRHDRLILDRDTVRVDLIRAETLLRDGRILRYLIMQRGSFLEGYQSESVRIGHWIDRRRALQRDQVEGGLASILSTSPQSVLRLEPALPRLQKVVQHPSLLIIAKAVLAYQKGELTTARWWLSRLPAQVPPDLRDTVHRVRLGTQRRPRMTPGAAPLGPLVGRSKEMAWLQSEWAKVEKGLMRTVSVTGALGIGKTRLVKQIARWAVIRGGFALHVRCGARNADVVGQVIRQLGRDAPVHGIAQNARDKLDSEILSALEGIERDSVRRPGLLVFDDMQNADQPARRLVQNVLTLPTTTRLLVLLVRRAVSSADDHPTSRNLHLRKLLPRDIEALIEKCGPQTLPLALRDQIVEAAKGNPLFAREYLHVALTSGSGPKAVWNHDRNEALSALLRGKDRSSRTLLGYVALARTPLSPAELREVTSFPQKDVRERLARMEAEGLVIWDADGVHIEQDFYRSIVVRTMLGTNEQRYHRVLARWFAARGPRYAAEAGYHFEAASDYRAALRCTLRAAAVSVRSSHRAVTEDLLSAASRLCSYLQKDSTRLTLLRAHFHYEWEEYGLAVPLYRDVIRRNSQVSAREQLRCRVRYLRSAAVVGYRPIGFAAYRGLVGSARRMGSPEIELEAAYAAFSALSDTADRSDYRQLATDFWGIAQRSPDHAVAVRALCQAALLYLGGARPALAEKTSATALRRSGGVPLPSLTFEAHVVRATVHICRGDLRAAKIDIDAAEAIASVLRRLPRRKLWDVNSGVYYLERGEWLAAEERFRQLFLANEKNAAGVSNVVVAVNLAVLYYEQDRTAEALTYAKVAQQLDQSRIGDSAPAHAIEGLILMSGNDVQGARRKADLLRSTRPYFGDHSYASILTARLVGLNSPSEAAASLHRDANRWGRLYYPASARMRLEAYRFAPDMEQIQTLKIGADRWELRPIVWKAQRMLDELAD